LALAVEIETQLDCEIARLRLAIGREATAVGEALTHDPSSSDGHGTQHTELSRQLRALHEHVAQAPSRSEDQRDLRADLATLLSFAKTLRTDAEAWRAALEAELKALERQQAAALEARKRLAAERETLKRRRDALQFTIDETAGRIAHDYGGDCRCTLPVFRLDEAVSVCSVAVLSPRRWPRLQQYWLVTLNDARDHVQVRRTY
jgi:hypothetical protein